MIFKSARIHDIAKEANVSISTVSRMFNHPEAVSVETQQSINEAMLRLGISVNTKSNYTVAMSHAKEISSSNIIIVLLRDIGNPFFSDILQGIDSSLKTHGLSVFLYVGSINKYTLQNFLSMLKDVHAIGIISLITMDTDSLTILHEIAPVIQCCDRYEESFLTSYVGIDDRAAAKKATEYIISTGHKRIAFLNTSNRLKFAEYRFEGFMEAIDEANLTVSENWIANLPNQEYATAHAAIARILSSDSIPNAIFATSDVFAIAALNVARDLHFRVPKDIIIVGFDDVNISMMSHPTITTISQPRYQIGYTAGELLFETINNPNMPTRNIIYDTTLVLRGSSNSSSTGTEVVRMLQAQNFSQKPNP